MSLAAVFWLSPGKAAPPPRDAVQVQMDVSYGPLTAEVGDIYRPAHATGPRPAVVIIHGGGWVAGSRSSYNAPAQLLASMGMVVLNIDYRLAVAARPDTHWPAQLVDAQLAVRFLRAHAAEFGVDPAHIGAIGDSAGGQLAVLLGVLHQTVAGDEAAVYPNERSDVQAVVDEFGALDVTGMGQPGQGMMAEMFGTTTPPAQATLSAKPIPVVTADSAPTYIIHGTADDVVPIAQSYELRDALQAHGVPVVLVTYAGGHGFSGIALNKAVALQINAMRWLAGILGVASAR